MTNKEVIIYGCGGHARSVADVILSSFGDVHLTFVDKNAMPGEQIFGFDVVPEVEPTPDMAYFLAIGDNQKRRQMREALNQHLIEVVAHNAHVGREATIGPGCFVGHEAYIGPLAEIGENTIINTRAIIEHEVVIGKDSQIAPGVIIGGRTRIGDNVFVGLGATILDGLEICPDVVIGASAVVVKNISEPGTYVGIPAKKTL